MGNEVIIEVSATNAEAKAVFADTEAQGKALGAKGVTVPVKAQLAFDQVNGPGALTKEIAKGPPVQVPVVADNPINEAWVAQVRSSVKSLSTQALDIPVDADMVPFQQQLETVLAELATTTKADIPVDVGDAMIFRAQVEELVAQVEASTKAVIDIQVNEGGLTDLQAKTLAASQAELELVAAEQKLNQAYASGDEDQVVKARDQVVSATKNATAATGELRAAQAAAAEGATVMAEAEDVAGAATRGLSDLMGPLFMVMNVLQLGMFAFGSTSSDTAQKAQDLSQQIIGLGEAAGSSASSMLQGDGSLKSIAFDLDTAGSSAQQFSQAFSGSLGQATQYVSNLQGAQAKLGAQLMTVKDTGTAAGYALGLVDRNGAHGAISVADLTKAVNDNTNAYNELSPAAKSAVDQYNAFNNIIPQARNALDGMKAAAAANQQTLAALGFTMDAGQNKANEYGLGIQAAAKALQDATAGSTYLEDSTDKASITAGQAVQNWQQLNAQYASSREAAAQAAEGVANAEHSVVTAEQGVESALHSQEQAVLAVGQAQHSYTEAVYQETQAQQAVTAARAAAEQQLVSLKLQADSAATSALSAKDALFSASQEASKYGVNSGNAQSVAAEPENAGNAKKIEAAIALLQAEDQLAQAQNASTQAQSSLNTARQQGIDKNPQVLAAEKSLTDAQYAVKEAAQGVANAQYAEQQAAVQVANAEWGVHEASQAVAQAERAEYQATVAVNQARDNLTRSTDANTLAGAQNRQMIEQIFTAYENEYGNEQLAAAATQKVGQQMRFTSGQIDDVIGSLNGLNGTNAKFSVTGTPSLNPQQLTQVGQELGMNFAQIEAILPGPGQAGYQAPRRAKATGGPGGGLTWVGEYGPELVSLPYGSEVIPAANAAQMALVGDVAPHHANGGPVGAAAVLGANLPLVAQWGALDAVGQTLHALGGPAVKLPPAGQVDFGGLLAGGGGGFGSGNSHVSGNRAANKAIMQAVFASYGWGSGPAWAAQDYVEMREARYNNYAQNPTSTAFGMGQFLDSTWGAYGFRKTADPRIQSIAMAEYEKARYGGPIGAAQHERTYNWYANGGPSGGLAVVGERGPELVRTPGGRGAGFAGPVEVKVKLEFTGSFASMFKEQVRTGQIRITSSAGPVVVS